MIVNNNEITNVYYSGYTIVRIYGCGDELVFGNEPTPVSYKATLTLTDNTEVNIPLDDVTTVLPDEVSAYSASVVSVVVHSGMTRMADELFRGCPNLSSVTLADTVLSVGQNVFSGCTALTEVSIGTGCTVISQGAFHDCTALTGITIPDSVESIYDNAFYGCSSLANVSIGTGLTTISSLTFTNCTSLSALTLPDNIVTVSNYAFSGCTSLKDLTIGTGCTAINQYAFRGCTSLSSITCNAVSAPTINRHTFREVATGGTLYYPEGSDYSQWLSTDEYYLGYYSWIDWASIPTPCFAVTDDISSYTDTEFTDVYNKATSKWYKLNNNNTYEQYGVFETGTSLNDFTYYEGKLVGIDGVEYQRNGSQWNNVGTYTAGTSTSYEISQDTVSEYVGQTWATSFKIAKSELEQLGSLNFSIYGEDAVQLTITFEPPTLSYTLFTLTDNEDGTAEDDGTYYSFNISLISDIVIQEIEYYESTPIHLIVGDTSAVLTVEYAEKAKPEFTITASTTADLMAFECPFVGQFGVVGTDVYAFDSNYNWSISEYNMFALYSDGNANVIPTGSTTLTYDEARPSDYEDSVMTDVIIGSGVTSIEDSAFNNLTSLSSVTMADSITTMGYGVFYNCRSISSITLSDSLTSLGSQVFRGCTALTTIEIPSGVSALNGATFMQCTSLSSITLSNGLTTIGDDVFNSCSSLASITIPASVTSLGSNVFANCTSLASITALPTSAPSVRSYTFFGIKTGGKLYYPSGSNYSSWRSSSNYYLGKYGWSSQQITS